MDLVAQVLTDLNLRGLTFAANDPELVIDTSDWRLEIKRQGSQGMWHILLVSLRLKSGNEQAAIDWSTASVRFTDEDYWTGGNFDPHGETVIRISREGDLMAITFHQERIPVFA